MTQWAVQSKDPPPLLPCVLPGARLRAGCARRPAPPTSQPGVPRRAKRGWEGGCSHRPGNPAVRSRGLLALRHEGICWLWSQQVEKAASSEAGPADRGGLGAIRLVTTAPPHTSLLPPPHPPNPAAPLGHEVQMPLEQAGFCPREGIQKPRVFLISCSGVAQAKQWSSSSLSPPPFSRSSHPLSTTSYQEGTGDTVSFGSGVTFAHSLIRQTSLSVCWLTGNSGAAPTSSLHPGPPRVTAGGEPWERGVIKELWVGCEGTLVGASLPEYSAALSDKGPHV